MLVEFIGAAGVGKTYLSDRVREALQNRGAEARNFDLIRISRIAPRNLVLALQAAYLAATTKPKKPLHVIRIAGIIARYSIRRKICEQIGGINITSEGLFHRIIPLHRISRISGKVQLAEVFFRRIQPPDVVVVLEAKSAIIFDRRRSRDRADDVFSRESVRVDIEDVKESIGAIEHIRQSISPSMRVLRMTVNDDGGEMAVARIIDVLEGLKFGLQPNSSVDQISLNR